LKKSTSKKSNQSSSKSAASQAAAPKASNSTVDVELLKVVSAFMRDHDIIELEVSTEKQDLRLKRGTLQSSATPAPSFMFPMSQSAPAAAPAPAASSASAANAAPKVDSSKFHVVTSPFVGTFYRAAGPNQDSFVDVGKTVNAGDSLCIVEAMKLMNEIESDVKGRVVRVLVDNATPVEFGEPLFEIEAF
jgi:acetyl-CoA carboxylase biotin carboxyl carrier protein